MRNTANFDQLDLYVCGNLNKIRLNSKDPLPMYPSAEEEAVTRMFVSVCVAREGLREVFVDRFKCKLT